MRQLTHNDLKVLFCLNNAHSTDINRTSVSNMCEYMHNFWILPKTISQYYKKTEWGKNVQLIKNNNEQ